MADRQRCDLDVLYRLAAETGQILTMQWQADNDIRILENMVLLARRGVAMAPDNKRTWLALSSALSALGRNDEAAQALQSRLLIQPSFDLHLQLSAVLLRLDKYEEALEQAWLALAPAPGDEAAGKLERDLLLRLKLAPPDDAAMMGAPWRALTQQARAAGAQDTLALCDRVLEAEPGNTNAKYENARALHQLGRTDDARSLMAMDRLLWQGAPARARRV